MGPATAAMMRHACAESCGTCDQPLPPSDAFACIDRRADCATVTLTDCDAAPLVLWRRCPVACRICSRSSISSGAVGMRAAIGRGGQGCVDRRADCAQRADAGECTAHETRSAMAVECAASCGTCVVRQGVSAPAVASRLGAPSGGAGQGELLGGSSSLAGVRGVTGCRDERKACAELADAGECAREVALMRSICAASCGACVQSMAERTVPYERCFLAFAGSSPAAAAGPAAAKAFGSARGVADRAAGRRRERLVLVREDRLAECSDWAAAGECGRSVEVAQMCACSCDDGPASSSERDARARAEAAAAAARDAEDLCVDSHARCEGWALIGLCASIPVRDRCERSCGACLAEEAGDVPNGQAGGRMGETVSPAMFEWIGSWCADVREAVQGGGPERRRGRRGVGSASFPTVPSLAPLPLSAVRLTPGSAYYQAQSLNVAFLLSLQPHRLLWSFYSTAGLDPSGEPYGGWESAAHVGWPDAAAPTRTLRGHFVGHYLSAASLAFSATGDEALAGRVRLLVAEIGRCQAALRSGFVAAWPAAVLDALERGSFSQVWAPWYTLHKLLAGLLDAHEHVFSVDGGAGTATAGTPGWAASKMEALAIGQRLTLYLARRVARLRTTLGERWWQATLEVEFGGIGEALVRMAAASRAAANTSVADEALGLARAFYKERFLGPLSRGTDALAGLHANTHLPLLTAAAQLAAEEARRDASALDGAEEEMDDWEWTDAAGGEGVRSPRGLMAATVHAYCTLQLGYAYAGTGGSSVNEHWPTAPASTGASLETLWVPEGLEDVGEANCAELALRGECERSAAYMLSHCAASCAARSRELLRARLHEHHHFGHRSNPERSVSPFRGRADGDAEAGSDGGDEVAAAAGEAHAHSSVGPSDSFGFHTQESCTQYNALKVVLELFTRSTDAALADAYERKQTNGVMGVAHPTRAGEMLYMTPMGAGVDKARANWVGYGEPTNAFWCCTGTGVESFATLGGAVFFTPVRSPLAAAAASTARHRQAGGPELWLSQFVPSTALWKEGGALVRLSTALRQPGCDAFVVTLSLAPAGEDHSLRRGMAPQRGTASASIPQGGGACFSPAGCTLVIRIPSWADGETSSVDVSGAHSGTHAAGNGGGSRLRPGSFMRVHRRWGPEGGASVTATFGLYVYSEPLNDWRPRYRSSHTLLYGPHVLVGLTTSDERTLDLAPQEVRHGVRVSACAAAEEGDGSASWLRLRLTTGGSGAGNAWDLAGGGASGGAMTLLPLAAVHDEQRYTAFFTLRDR